MKITKIFVVFGSTYNFIYGVRYKNQTMYINHGLISWSNTYMIQKLKSWKFCSMLDIEIWY
jgi:hypothetical protein